VDLMPAASDLCRRDQPVTPTALAPIRLIGFFSEINGPHSHLINELRIIGIL
jgi:hypothetical protein